MSMCNLSQAYKADSTFEISINVIYINCLKMKNHMIISKDFIYWIKSNTIHKKQETSNRGKLLQLDKE